MKVILQEDVKKLGKKGDIIEVKEGYARNYLLPRNLAVEASDKNVQELKREEKIKADKAEKQRQDAEKLADKIKNITVTLQVKSGDNGKLFGAVTTKDIAENLNKKHKVKIDKRKIDLKENIKSLGTYNVDVKLHPEVTAQLTVQVTAE